MLTLSHYISFKLTPTLIHAYWHSHSHTSTHLHTLRYWFTQNDTYSDGHWITLTLTTTPTLALTLTQIHTHTDTLTLLQMLLLILTHTTLIWIHTANHTHIDNHADTHLLRMTHKHTYTRSDSQDSIIECCSQEELQRSLQRMSRGISQGNISKWSFMTLTLTQSHWQTYTHVTAGPVGLLGFGVLMGLAN